MKYAIVISNKTGTRTYNNVVRIDETRECYCIVIKKKKEFFNYFYPKEEVVSIELKDGKRYD